MDTSTWLDSGPRVSDIAVCSQPSLTCRLYFSVAEAAPKFWKDVPWKEILKDPALAVYSPHRLRNIFRHYVSSVEPDWRNLDFRGELDQAISDWQ